MAEQPIGPILDGLGVTIDLDEGALVENALVLGKVVQPDGTVTLMATYSDGMSWLEQLGLIAAAKQMTDGTPWQHGDHD